MKAQIKSIRHQFNSDMKPELILTLSGKLTEEYNELQKAVSSGKLLDAEIKVHRNKRSLDANSYAWVLISKIAEEIKSSKEEVYIQMLRRYGQAEQQLLSVVSEAADMIYRATQNHCHEVGESELNGKLFKHFRILIGSSQYDTASMSRLIDGIVSEAKELDIETLTPDELAKMKADWRG